MPKRNDLVRCDDKCYRILEVKGDKCLVIDCVKRTMPVIIKLPEELEPVNTLFLTEVTGKCLETFKKASVERQNTAYKRFSMIAGILPVIGNKAQYTVILDTVSKESGLGKQTIRKYLCEYLVFQDNDQICKVNAGGKKSRDYTAMDEHLFPQIKMLIAEMFDESHKPEKVSVFKIEQKLGLKNKTLYHLPKCMSLIQEYSESWEQFWIRELNWQYTVLNASRIPVTISTLAKRPFNLSKNDLIRVLPLLNDGIQTQAEIKELLVKQYCC